MDREMRTATRTKWTVAAVVALAALGIGAPLAYAQGIGAPTSAAGGPSAPSSPSLPSGAGPIGPSGGTLGGSAPGGLSSDSDSSRIRALQPGTGKFEGGNNAPCVGSSGFGSSSAQPGHAC